LYLGQFDPLEDIKGCLGERPVDNRAQLENERNGQVGAVDVRADGREAVYKEAATANRWQSHFDLVSADSEVNAPEYIEELDVAIVLERIALIVGIPVINYFLIWA